MTDLFRIDPTTADSTAPLTVGTMAADATHPAIGQASTPLGILPVNLCGAKPYKRGGRVVMVIKTDIAFAILEPPDAPLYYPSRRWIPFKDFAPNNHAARALYWIMRKCPRTTIYEAVTVARKGGDGPISGSASARFTGGHSASIPIRYAGKASQCNPGINLAHRRGGEWEIIGGDADVAAWHVDISAGPWHDARNGITPGSSVSLGQYDYQEFGSTNPAIYIVGIDDAKAPTIAPSDETAPSYAYMQTDPCDGIEKPTWLAVTRPVLFHGDIRAHTVTITGPDGKSVSVSWTITNRG